MTHSIIKRGVDILGATVGLVVLIPVFVVISALVKLSSPGPVLFRQTRVGRNMTPFTILKFRTMVVDAPEKGPAVTIGADPRVTGVGRALRSTKLDELPQLYNILIGDMSFVGPRPEVPRYVGIFWQDYLEILKIRPGITDLASIAFRNESSLLSNCTDPEVIYIEEILPKKIALAKTYLRRASPLFDCLIVILTIAAVCGWSRLPVKVSA